MESNLKKINIRTQSKELKMYVSKSLIGIFSLSLPGILKKQYSSLSVSIYNSIASLIFTALLKEAHQLSTINRKESDKKTAEADAVLKEIEKLQA